MELKEALLKLFENLWHRGEMIKGHVLLNECVPMELRNDADIIELRSETRERLSEISKWNKTGRPYQENHAFLENPLLWPKFKLAYDKIKSIDAKSVLDCGTYTGDFIGLLSKENIKCVGLDIHIDLIERLNKKYSGNPLFLFSNLRMNPVLNIMQKFDVVMALDVLEHVPDSVGTLNLIHYMAKPGGLVIINLPKSNMEYKDEALEHLRMYDESDIVSIWGGMDNFKMEDCKDELDRDTSFFTYTTPK